MSRVRFRYGQHETFTVRHGWLPKGLAALTRSAGALRGDPEAADRLGLGSKMVPSLAFWMEACGLARRDAGSGAGRMGMMLTGLGEAVRDADPYLEHPATLWLLHLQISGQEGTAWNWFFTEFDDRSFDRNACADAFVRYTRDRAQKPATPAMAAKDVACLLLTYASDPAGDREDADDVAGSPLRDLGLLWRHATTGRFERRHADGIPPEALLACARTVASGRLAVPLSELAHARRGAGRLLGMRPGDVADAAEAAAGKYRADGVQVITLAGDRVLSVPAHGPQFWLRRALQRPELAA